MKTRLLLCLLLGALLLACIGLPAPVPMPIPAFTASPVAIASPLGSETPSDSASDKGPADLPPTATPRPARPSPSPVAGWNDLAPYRAAMRPEFADDLAAFGQATQYRIALTLAADLSHIDGTQTVHYINTEDAPLTEIYFRLFPNLDSYGGTLTLTSVTLDGTPITPTYTLNDSAARLPLATPLALDAAVDITLHYTVEIPTQGPLSGYDHFGYYDEVLALPNVYPIIPVYDKEGWNVELSPGYGDAVFSDSALYQVTLTAPAAQVVATSGVCTVSAPENDQRTWECVSGPMRDFMLAMSTRYETTTTESEGVTVTSYYLPEDAANGAKAMQIVADAIKVYTARFGPFPYNALDLLETPTTAGGIEYPGLIVVAADLYQRPSRYFEFATAHEAAHQWWYSLIGNDQLDSPWLDESLAQFSTALYYNDIHSQSEMNVIITNAFEIPYQDVRDSGQDMPVDLPVADYDEGAYGAIVYGKGPLFFNALYEHMGDAAYNRFMQTYFSQHRYGIAYPADLLAAAQTELDAPTLSELYTQWIHATQP